MLRVPYCCHGIHDVGHEVHCSYKESGRSQRDSQSPASLEHLLISNFGTDSKERTFFVDGCGTYVTALNLPAIRAQSGTARYDWECLTGVPRMNGPCGGRHLSRIWTVLIHAHSLSVLRMVQPSRPFEVFPVSARGP